MTIGSTRRNLSLVVVASGLRIVVAAPLSLVVLPVAFRRLNPGQYGVWAVLSAILAIAAFAEAGVKTEIVRRVAEAVGRNDGRAVLRIAREGWVVLSAVGAVVAVLGWIVSPGLVHLVVSSTDQRHAGVDVVLLCRATMLVFALGLATTGAFAVLGGVQRADWDNYAAVVGSITSSAVVVIALVAGIGLWAFVAGSISYIVVESIVRTIGVRQVLPAMSWTVVRIPKGVARSYFGVSALLVLSQVSNVFDYEFDKILLSRWVGSATAGHYNVGSTLTLQARTAALLPLVVLVPGVAELQRYGRAHVLALYDSVVAGLAVGVTGLLGGIVLFAEPFVGLWLGPGHREAAVAARLLAIAMMVNAISAPGAYYCVARGWMRVTAISSITNIVVNGVTSAILIAHAGLDGALIGSFAGNAAGVGVFLLVLRRRDRDLWRRGLVRASSYTMLCVVIAVTTGLASSTASWLGLIGRVALWVVLILVFALPFRFSSTIRRFKGHGVQAPAV